jgi:hypothetical protein
MPRAATHFLLASLLLVCLLGTSALAWTQPHSYVETRSLAAPEATQAAAADERHVYAIDNRRIARYDRHNGQRLAESRGEAFHLNSGFLWQGKLYCAHSNFPRTPAQCVVKTLDLQSMQLADHFDFGDRYGSLTWVVRHADAWWCNFAHYGADNAKTLVVRFDDQWRKQNQYTYPRELIADLGTYSLSGGLWLDEHLLVIGHDKPKIYRLRLPSQGNVLTLVDTFAVPFPGQGIALDPVTGGLIGIERARRRVIFAEQPAGQ